MTALAGRPARVPSWDHGVVGKVSGLAGARVVAQLLGLAWFLVAARVFSAVEFGVLSTALVLVVVIGGLSDLGTTRTVVRHVAADRTSLRSSFIRATALRGGAGLALALVVIAVAPQVQDTISAQVVALAGLIAVASGITEIGFAALRSVGSVTTEGRLLVGERALFVVAGTAIVLTGGGPVAVLAAYAATNLVSAGVVSVRALGFPGGAGTPSGPLLDAEGRHTAVGSTLVIVGPRVSALLLVVLSTPTVVGTFSIAQKVPEALGILGAAVLLPLLPMVRSQLLDGRGERAVQDAGRVTATVLMAMVPASVLLAVDGRRVLDLLFGAGNRPGSVATLALLAAVSVLWVVRTYGEVLLLAQERAARYLVAVTAGILVNLAVGVVLVRSSASSASADAALAALLAEVVVLIVTFSSLRTTVGPATRRLLVPVVLIGVAASATALGGRALPLAFSVLLVGSWAVVGIVVVGLPLLERRGAAAEAPVVGSGPAGDDPDVREQLGGDLGRDGVEAVEYLAGPTDHL